MDTKRHLARALIVLAISLLVLSACQQNSTAPFLTTSGRSVGSTAAKGSLNGAAGQSPAYYDSTLFTINLRQFSDASAIAIHEHNKSFNIIYATNDLDEPQQFTPVIDAIPGDGFNPLWEQQLIVFNPGFTPHQFFSDDEVLAAAQGPNPEITIVDTDEFYRCSVVGSK